LRDQPNNAPETLVELRGLAKRYPGGTQALIDVSLDLHTGEFITIIGRSGAGKSTLLRCLNRMIAPTEGRYLLRGRDVSHATGRHLREVRQHVGMIFQQFNLVGRLTVLENVIAGRLRFMRFDWRNPSLAALFTHPASLFRWFRRTEQYVAFECLRELGIEQLAFRRADTLSGGQQQRVAIARVMAQQPDLILADEPIASLDPRSAMQVMDGLRTLHQNYRVPVMVNLHQVDVAVKYATRVIGISHGRVVFDGPPETLEEADINAIYDGKPQYQQTTAKGEADEADTAFTAPATAQRVREKVAAAPESMAAQ
jgi:phosphonate transport system ATP-binding protein